MTSQLLTDSQVDPAAAVLARALREDPFQLHLLGDRPPSDAERFLRSNIRMGRLFGEVWTTPDVEGVAVWIGPEHAHLTLAEVWRSGFFGGSFSLGVTPFIKVMRAAGFVERIKKQQLSTPHWTLSVLGVDPAHQGRGLGARLIRPILDRADADGVHCYLESSNDRNVSFYLRRGFETVREERLPMGGPAVRMMLREPQ